MPNIRGGKLYKKSKGKTKFGEDSEEVVFIEKQPDQMVGRLVKLLGNLNATIYCEDGKQRVCKICRSIKKSVRFESGDIVLISLRDCDMSKHDLENGLRSSRGDILAKYNTQQYKVLMKEGLNPNLFIQLDKVAEMTLKLKAGDKEGAEAIAADIEEDIFDRNQNDVSENSDESESSDDLDIDKI